MPKTPSEKPFLVKVTEDRYDMFGDPQSVNHRKIQNAIELMGGISDSVEPGTYVIELKTTLFTWSLTMQPYEEEI